MARCWAASRMTSHVLDEIERYYHAPDIIVTSRHRPSLMTTIQPALDHFDPDSQRRMFSNGQVGAKRILHVLERTSIPVEKEREREREWSALNPGRIYSARESPPVH